MIEVRGLSYAYGAGKARTEAVRGLTFDVARGEVFGFLGPNGAGKTTTIRMLTGILTPTAGTARISGFDVVEDPLGARTAVGYMPERPGFTPTFTVAEVCSDLGGCFLTDRSALRERTRTVLEQVNLWERRNSRTGTLSHGMRQRLALAQALIHDPPVLILDEPMSGLDPRGTREFRGLLRTIAGEGRTVFLSSHILPEVQAVCERVGIIHRGELRAVDTIGGLAARLERGTVRIRIFAPGADAKGLAIVRAVPGVVEATLWRQGYDVVAEGRETAGRINRALVLAGAEVRSISVEEADLEDVFMAVTGGGAS